MPYTNTHVLTSADSFPYIDRGEGSPLLFVHGAACDHRVWAPHIAQLEGRHRCIAPTLRWFGSTIWNGDPTDFGERAHARDLVEIVEALDCGPVAVVGWSYGANVALRLTVERPDLVTRVVAYEPSATSLVSDADEISAHQASMRETFLPVTDAAAAGDVLGVLTSFIDAVGGAGTFANLPPEFRQACIENARSLLPLLNSKHRFDSVSDDDLAGLSMPVHVAWGEQSGKVWTIPSEAAARVATVRGHVVPGAGHVWPAMDPVGFLTWMDESGALGSLPNDTSSKIDRPVDEECSWLNLANISDMSSWFDDRFSTQ